MLEKALNCSHSSAQTNKDIKVELMFLFGFVHNMLMENTEINTPSTWAYDLYGQVSFKNMP